MNSTIKIADFPLTAGVYMMLNAAKEVLYVGKAKNLRRRISSYFKPQVSLKIKIFRRQIVQVKTIVTSNESEALLLECNLIKLHRPKYNVLLKDDKNYAYLAFSKEPFPQLKIMRKGRKISGWDWFGPFTNANAVRESFQLLQRIFRLRSCNLIQSSFRSRACLLYQINLCSAPCIGKISLAEYQHEVQLAKQLLRHEGGNILPHLTQLMEEAAQKLAFEQAAFYRDQIRNFQQLQTQQVAVNQTGYDGDVFALVEGSEQVVIGVTLIRHGLVIQHDNFDYQKNDLMGSEKEWLSNFINDYYFGPNSHDLPRQLIVNQSLPLLAEVMQAKGVNFKANPRGKARQILQLTEQNAQVELRKHLDWSEAIQELGSLLGSPLGRIETFDVSHHQGEATVAACIVFEGILRKDKSRNYALSSTHGDDFAALAQALSRHYQSGSSPQILLIDGGRPQLQAVATQCKVYGWQPILLGIAKGDRRKEGLETIYRYSEEQPLPVSMKVLHFLIYLRNAAHQAAINYHRKTFIRRRLKSTLDSLKGVGIQRRRALLIYFGDLAAIRGAGIAELAKVPNIGPKIAQQLYRQLHE